MRTFSSTIASRQVELKQVTEQDLLAFLPTPLVAVPRVFFSCSLIVGFQECYGLMPSISPCPGYYSNAVHASGVSC